MRSESRTRAPQESTGSIFADDPPSRGQTENPYANSRRVPPETTPGPSRTSSQGSIPDDYLFVRDPPPDGQRPAPQRTSVPSQEFSDPFARGQPRVQFDDSANRPPQPQEDRRSEYERPATTTPLVERPSDPILQTLYGDGSGDRYPQILPRRATPFSPPQRTSIESRRSTDDPFVDEPRRDERRDEPALSTPPGPDYSQIIPPPDRDNRQPAYGRRPTTPFSAPQETASAPRQSTDDTVDLFADGPSDRQNRPNQPRPPAPEQRWNYNANEPPPAPLNDPFGDEHRSSNFNDYQHGHGHPQNGPPNHHPRPLPNPPRPPQHYSNGQSPYNNPQQQYGSPPGYQDASEGPTSFADEKAAEAMRKTYVAPDQDGGYYAGVFMDYQQRCGQLRQESIRITL